MKRATRMWRDCCDCGVIVASGDSRCRRCTELRKRRAEIRDLKARLKAVRDTEQFDGLSSAVLSPEEIRRRRATDLKNKNWRKP